MVEEYLRQKATEKYWLNKAAIRKLSPPSSMCHLLFTVIVIVAAINIVQGFRAGDWDNASAVCAEKIF